VATILVIQGTPDNIKADFARSAELDATAIGTAIADGNIAICIDDTVDLVSSEIDVTLRRLADEFRDLRYATS
jgi:hypothetical protein